MAWKERKGLLYLVERPFLCLKTTHVCNFFKIAQKTGRSNIFSFYTGGNYNISHVALYNTQHSFLSAPWTSLTPSSQTFSVIFSWIKNFLMNFKPVDFRNNFKRPVFCPNRPLFSCLKREKIAFNEGNSH